jgi:predicted P-loop ATPase
LVETAAKPADAIIVANTAADGFKRNEHGQILKGHRRNIELAIERLGVTLRKNEFSQQTEISGLPGVKPILSDEGSICLRFTIDEIFKFLPVKDLYEDILINEAQLKGWLSYYLGAEPSPYAQEIGPMFFVALVARVFDPGCKHDHMLVLEGPQGALKSTACSIIAGGWFSDNLPDLREGKEVSQHLQGKWLIEMSELSAMRRADVETLKDFISRERDLYRPPYGRREVDHPRQCVFVGTTNDHIYLKDSTGGRRFWPVKVGSIDLDALRHDRDQLFAEAVRSFRAGAHWWPEKELEDELIKAEQEARYAQDLWHEDVERFLVDKKRVTVGQIAKDGLYISDKSRLGMTENMRIIGILTSLGWARNRSHGKRWYEPPKNWQPSHAEETEEAED